MPKLFLIAGALALSGIVAGMLAVSREPAASAPVVAKFDARWDDVSTDEPLLKKQDRLALPAPEPLTVQTERMVPEPVPAQVEAKPAEPKPIRHVEHVEHESNVCTRHHMRKVMTHGGRSWRCRR